MQQKIKPFIILNLEGKLMKKSVTALLCVALVSTTIISATAESQSTLI